MTGGKTPLSRVIVVSTNEKKALVGRYLEEA